MIFVLVWHNYTKYINVQLQCALNGRFTLALLHGEFSIILQAKNEKKTSPFQPFQVLRIAKFFQPPSANHGGASGNTDADYFFVSHFLWPPHFQNRCVGPDFVRILNHNVLGFIANSHFLFCLNSFFKRWRFSASYDQFNGLFCVFFQHTITLLLKALVLLNSRKIHTEVKTIYYIYYNSIDTQFLREYNDQMQWEKQEVKLIFFKSFFFHYYIYELSKSYLKSYLT